ncbi:venom protease-like [Brevipalpus obovatus]|uniref:venom protease-like n=1 Tax=Brevipalpus obovatus TaxID=246614 RepID=UPI003D9E311F
MFPRIFPIKYSSRKKLFISSLRLSSSTSPSFHPYQLIQWILIILTIQFITSTMAHDDPYEMTADCDCGRKPFSPHTRVFGGKETLNHEYPWMAHLRFYPNKNKKRFFYCGGSLIDEKHIMTAAHCLHTVNKTLYPFDNVKVYLGLTNLKNLTKPFYVEEYFYPSAYDPTYPVEFDFAILRLTEKVIFSDIVYPICLPEKGEPIKFNDLYVAGWGHSTRERKKINPKLIHARVKYINHRQCDKMRKEYLMENYPKYRKNPEKFPLNGIHYNHMCAMDVKSSADACQGDSGGPLMAISPKNGRYFLVGVVSGGYNECGAANSPTLYTIVTHFHHITQSHVQEAQICEF